MAHYDPLVITVTGGHDIIQHLTRIEQKVDTLMADLTTALADLDTFIADVKTHWTELQAGMADLKAQLAAATNVDPALQAAADRVEAAIVAGRATVDGAPDVPAPQG